MDTHLIPPHTLAKRWNLQVRTLSQWRWNGRGPLYLKIGRRVMYRLEDVENFEAKNLRSHTSGYAI